MSFFTGDVCLGVMPFANLCIQQRKLHTLLFLLLLQFKSLHSFHLSCLRESSMLLGKRICVGWNRLLLLLPAVILIPHFLSGRSFHLSFRILCCFYV